MRYDKQQITDKLLRWESFLHNFNLPRWDELPQIDLYMDQVIVLLNDYLGPFSYSDGSDEKLITAAMVNNYVKMKLVPAPVKKKYCRQHLALLIMLCTLKQTLSIAVVSRMLPHGNEEQIKRDYDQFVDIHKGLCYFFTDQVKCSASALLNPEKSTDNDVNDLIVGSAVAASFYKLLAAKLVSLQLPQAAEKNE